MNVVKTNLQFEIIHLYKLNTKGFVISRNFPSKPSNYLYIQKSVAHIHAQTNSSLLYVLIH